VEQFDLKTNGASICWVCHIPGAPGPSLMTHSLLCYAVNSHRVTIAGQVYWGHIVVGTFQTLCP
jgi:hypothetical protein